MHKSSQNPSKSTENRWKLRLGLVPGALGEALGVILAPKACLRQQRKARCPKMHQKWVPIWTSIGVIFLVFWSLFFNTFVEGLRTSLFIDFGSILASILGYFFWTSGFLHFCNPSLAKTSFLRVRGSHFRTFFAMFFWSDFKTIFFYDFRNFWSPFELHFGSKNCKKW